MMSQLIVQKKRRKRKLSGQTTLQLRGGALLVKKVELPDGFEYSSNVLDKKAHERIQLWIAENQHRFRPSPYGRRVLQFGFEYLYADRSLRELKEQIPTCLREVLLRNLDDACIMTQCIVNEYTSGQRISAHSDAKCFGNRIHVFSFGAPTTLVLKERKGKTKKPTPNESSPSPSVSERVVPVDVQANSYYLMENDARWKWTHETVKHSAVHTKPRYSFTFRSVVQRRDTQILPALQ